MDRICDLLALYAFTAVSSLAAAAIDPVGAEAHRALTDERLAAFLAEAAA